MVYFLKIKFSSIFIKLLNNNFKLKQATAKYLRNEFR